MTNIENKYNQNFYGVYCTCARPYPDPEGDEDDMLQCIICEDWYHLKVNVNIVCNLCFMYFTYFEYFVSKFLVFANNL